MAICLTYPTDYPSNHILVELKSKTLSDKLLCGLQGLAEKEAKQLKGQVCFNELIMLKTINGLYKVCIFQKFKLYNLSYQ